MRFTGAGVLVYAIDEKDVYVLLGREKETPGWRQGSKKWSSFSGKIEINETPLQTAAREFREETCAAVNLDACLLYIPFAGIYKIMHL